jgi:hypothetical protein
MTRQPEVGQGGQVDGKRPTRVVEELHQVAATRTERRHHVQVTYPNETWGELDVSPAADRQCNPLPDFAEPQD